MHNHYFTPEDKIFPEFDLGDVVLREKRMEDVEDFFAYYADPEVNKHILCEIPRNLEEARRELSYWRGIFHNNDGIYFAIALKNSNKLIGSIGLTGYNSYHSRIEISYDLAKEYWRLGITSKAIAAIVDYAFNDFYLGGINRIEAFTSIDNLASYNLLQKCGFIHEGTLRQHRYHKGKYVDAHSFSLLRSDYFFGK